MDEEQVKAFSEALNNFAASITAWAQNVWVQIVPVLQKISDEVDRQYKEAGMPYGDSQEACWRWFGEIQEVRRLEDQAQRLIDHHAGLVYFRKRLAEREER